MPLFQYQVKAEPVFSGKERTSPDKYVPQDYAPRANWNRRTSIAAVVLAINTAFAFVPVAPFAESVSIDKWHPVANTPRWDKVRNQHLYPAAVLGDVPRAESVSIDRWHPEIEKPRWDLKRQQHTFPYLFLGDIPRAANIPVDRWQPELSTPRWGFKRTGLSAYASPVTLSGDPNPPTPSSRQRWQPLIEIPRRDVARRQYTYPYFFFGDVPRGENVSVDRWHPVLEQPRRARVQPIFESGVNNPYPIPNPVTPVPFDWLQPTVDPFQPKPRIIVEGSVFVYPVSAFVTPFDWQVGQSIPVRVRPALRIDASVNAPSFAAALTPLDWLVEQALPARRKARTVDLNGLPAQLSTTPIVAFDWQIDNQQTKPQRPRREYIYGGVGVELSQPNAVFVDSWIPAQIYLRPLVIPIYWIAYGEVNLVIPGTRMPCILQADAVLVQPVCYCALLVPSEENYCATLIQPVGYCAEEIACEL